MSALQVTSSAVEASVARVQAELKSNLLSSQQPLPLVLDHGFELHQQAQRYGACLGTTQPNRLCFCFPA